jgi:hypothetical protein
MSYEFGGMLYRNSREMHIAIAKTWLSANGRSTRADMSEALATLTDDELADEAIDGWSLGEEDDDGIARPTGFARADLIAAFADLRTDFETHFPA